MSIAVQTSGHAVFGVICFISLVHHGHLFDMGKHSTPPTQFPMERHEGKQYAKVGPTEYVEYNQDEMYYDKHEKVKTQREMDMEDRDAIKASAAEKEEKHIAENAMKEVKRDQISDVATEPMYLEDTYGEMEYGKEPKIYGDKALGGGRVPDYNNPAQRFWQPNQQVGGDVLQGMPPMNNMFGGGPQYGGGMPPQYGGGMPPQYGGGMPQYGDQGVRELDDDYAAYLKSPPRGILTIRPLSDEETKPTTPTTSPEPAPHTGFAAERVPADNLDIPDLQNIPPVQEEKELPPLHQETGKPHREEDTEEVPRGILPGLSGDDFKKYHGSHGDLNLMPYDRKRRVIEMNERRAKYAYEMARKRDYPDFDPPAETTTVITKKTTSTATKPTTPFIPKREQTIPDFRLNMWA